MRATETTASPIGVTTDATLARDLTASQQAGLLKMDLEEHGICEARAAEKTAVLCVSLHEPATFDAAIWKGAEALYSFMDGRSDAVPLEQRDASVRALYLTLALNCFARQRLALEGGYSREQMAAAFAHFTNHVAQIGTQADAARRRGQMKAVRDGR